MTFVAIYLAIMGVYVLGVWVGHLDQRRKLKRRHPEIYQDWVVAEARRRAEMFKASHA